MIGSRPGHETGSYPQVVSKAHWLGHAHLWKWTIFSPKPSIPVQSAELYDFTQRLARSQAVRPESTVGLQDAALKSDSCRPSICTSRIADTAIDLYVGSCVLSCL
jgi:hypothetical protein